MNMAVVGGSTFIFVPAAGTGTNNRFHLSSGGKLTLISSIEESGVSSLQLREVANTAVAVIDEVAYLYVSINLDEGISVFSVSEAGALALELSSTTNSAFTMIGDAPLALIASQSDDALSSFEIGGDDDRHERRRYHAGSQRR